MTTTSDLIARASTLLHKAAQARRTADSLLDLIEDKESTLLFRRGKALGTNASYWSEELGRELQDAKDCLDAYKCQEGFEDTLRNAMETADDVLLGLDGRIRLFSERCKRDEAIKKAEATDMMAQLPSRRISTESWTKQAARELQELGLPVSVSPTNIHKALVSAIAGAMLAILRRQSERCVVGKPFQLVVPQEGDRAEIGLREFLQVLETRNLNVADNVIRNYLAEGEEAQLFEDATQMIKDALNATTQRFYFDRNQLFSIMVEIDEDEEETS